MLSMSWHIVAIYDIFITISVIQHNTIMINAAIRQITANPAVRSLFCICNDCTTIGPSIEGDTPDYYVRTKDLR